MVKAVNPYRRWLSVVVASTVLLAVVGYASNDIIGMFWPAIASVVVLVTAFHMLFGSNSLFFNIIFANAMTIYLCVFSFFVDSMFTSLSADVLGIGFMMPLAAFLAGAIIKRAEIRAIIYSHQKIDENEFIKSFVWLMPIAFIGIMAFVMHEGQSLPAETLRYYFLGEMGLISAIVALASKDFSLLLMDTGIVFKDFFSENAQMIKPAFAFFTFYSMNIIIFATIYRIIAHVSELHHFLVRGVARDLSFVEALYFSMVTVSTLGYGDIVPASNAIRFIVGVQTFMGTMLFFFGVHAILTHRRK